MTWLGYQYKNDLTANDTTTYTTSLTVTTSDADIKHTKKELSLQYDFA